MSRKALEDEKYELIKEAMLDPENNRLPAYLQESLDRTVQASKILDKNPVQKNAVALLMAKYPHLSRAQAYEDCKRAIRIFNTYHTIDYDYWQHWLLQDIAELIQDCKNANDRKGRAMAQKNLINALGERPETDIDAKLLEKHPINIFVQVNNKTIKLDYDKILKLKPEDRAIFTEALDQEIDDITAEEIMNS